MRGDWDRGPRPSFLRGFYDIPISDDSIKYHHHRVSRHMSMGVGRHMSMSGFGLNLELVVGIAPDNVISIGVEFVLL